jgi:hypothetical protein
MLTKPLCVDSELLVKCVERTSPEERVGVCAVLPNGGLGVLEYRYRQHTHTHTHTHTLIDDCIAHTCNALQCIVDSELPQADAARVNDDGTLFYHAAHICINSFTVGFVEVCCVCACVCVCVCV